MKLNHKQKMVISGTFGFTFFLIANFTSLFVGSSVLAGLMQITINVFVFFIYLDAFKKNTGLTKFVAFFGIVVPVIMISITLYRVVLPALF